jgi:hypothetical protein
MRDMAAARCASLIRDGRVEVREGTAHLVEFLPGSEELLPSALDGLVGSVVMPGRL